MMFIGSQCIDVMCCSVSVNLYDNLVSMGFDRRFAAEALKLSNNDLNAALQVHIVNVQLLYT